MGHHKHIFKLPEPVEGTDYYVDELRKYTISFTVDMLDFVYNESDEEKYAKAMDLLPYLPCQSEMVFSEKMHDVELDAITELPFDHKTWLKKKLLELGVHRDGTPLKSGEKQRPASEQTLDVYATTEGE